MKNDDFLLHPPCSNPSVKPKLTLIIVGGCFLIHIHTYTLDLKARGTPVVANYPRTSSSRMNELGAKKKKAYSPFALSWKVRMGVLQAQIFKK